MTPKIPQQHDPLGNFYEHEQIQTLKVCEVDGRNGLPQCNSLNLGLLLLHRLMAKIVVAGSAMGSVEEVRLIAACPACRRQRTWSAHLPDSAHALLLWKNLRLLQDGDISITWQMTVRPRGMTSDIAFGKWLDANTSITTLDGVQLDSGAGLEGKLPWRR